MLGGERRFGNKNIQQRKEDRKRWGKDLGC